MAERTSIQRGVYGLRGGEAMRGVHGPYEDNPLPRFPRLRTGQVGLIPLVTGAKRYKIGNSFGIPVQKRKAGFASAKAGWGGA